VSTVLLLPVPPAAVLERLVRQQLVLGQLALLPEPLVLGRPNPLAL
jgi:hypothetical protein